MGDKYFNNLIMNNNESKEYNNNVENNEYNSINDKEYNISKNNNINNNWNSINNFNYENANRKNNEDSINKKNIDLINSNNNNDNIGFDINKNKIKKNDFIYNENNNINPEETSIPTPMPINNDIDIDKIKEKIKEKKDDIVNQINAINEITQKHKTINENYRKALLLSLNSGFLLPKKIYSLYISSPYLYNNIKKEVMLRVALKKLETDYTKLNYFILEHVSYISIFNIKFYINRTRKHSRSHLVIQEALLMALKK